eukprot:m.135250 g.135250  ORF g.135250 m.135250 type:complete len:55 (+) comp20157_c4_seq1:258-422(+)
MGAANFSTVKIHLLHARMWAGKRVREGVHQAHCVLFEPSDPQAAESGGCSLQSK